LIFKTRIGGGYVFMFLVFTLFTLLSLYLCIINFSFRYLILGIAFTAAEVLLVIPMYFGTRYEVNEDGLRIRVGWFVNRNVPYCNIFAYRQTDQEPRSAYGLSEHHIAIYFKNDRNKDDVLSVSPKDAKGFIEALEEKTGVAITPPDRTFREVQDEYNKNTTPERRKAARQRMWHALSKGYDPVNLKPESPESLQEKLMKEQEEEAKKQAAQPKDDQSETEQKERDDDTEE
jgi:hypothetical protein